MILLLSQAVSETATDFIYTWIASSDRQVKRLNGRDFLLQKSKIVLSNLAGVESKVLGIDFSRVNVVFFRRYLGAGQNTLTQSDTLNLSNENYKNINIHLAKELRKFYDYFLTLFSDDVIFISSLSADQNINKIFVLEQAIHVGLDVPDSLITNCKQEVRRFVNKKGSCIVKALDYSEFYYFRKENIVFSMLTSEIDLRSMPDVFAPSLVQKNYRKEYEVRTFIFDGKCYSMAIFSQQSDQTSIDFRNYNHKDPNRTVPYNLPTNVEKKMGFIKKAMDNGFRIDLLKYLKCNYGIGTSRDCEVKIFEVFVEDNKMELLVYEESAFREYVKRIDKKLLNNLLSRHIQEQTYKNKARSLGMAIPESKRKYHEINRQNLLFLKSLLKQGRFMGEQNLGLMDDKLLVELDMQYMKNEQYLTDSILQEVGLPINTYVPIATMKHNYFGLSPLFIILFHNQASFKALMPYKDEMIEKGYLHPREFATLKLSVKDKKITRVNIADMKLRNFFVAQDNTIEINLLRNLYCLPPYQVDYEKYRLAEKYCLQLNFGMFYGSR